MLSTATSNASEGFSSVYQSIPRIQIVLPKIWLASKKFKIKECSWDHELYWWYRTDSSTRELEEKVMEQAAQEVVKK